MLIELQGWIALSTANIDFSNMNFLYMFRNGRDFIGYPIKFYIPISIFRVSYI